MTTDLDKLLSNLQIEQIDKYLFIGQSPRYPARVFGGQVLAQALNAALRTVDAERIAHSMHAYFLRPGNPKKQIVYEVDPIRDGRGFTTRRVVAKQDGRAIFNTSISFQVPESGPEHQFEAPDYPAPESLESDLNFWTRMSEEHPDRFDPLPAYPIERNPVVRPDYLSPEQDIGPPHTACWLRANGTMGDDLIQHQTALTYMSDMTLMGSAMRPHPINNRSKNMMFASLDHALWFHRPLRADEWLIYVHDSPAAAGARGFTRGTFYTREGELVASVAQEALMRI
ncbi:acyl-CoA thioesterase II [Halieaceae bacterium IMCC14734]|uniref:Acyl-CoA thioesterase II n=1 Tax=Candidatus Litorirhabdus singularis TaxID=2518993 RepID=A0ABT3TLR9_9GAMM|nr:acyl-CoA thioesterase II [Candidatus Litorirhabdus singularis]MCX2983268.1 acyl-CoA thioesterase II [Candidatus Litorirhabdus singularis]